MGRASLCSTSFKSTNFGVVESSGFLTNGICCAGSGELDYRELELTIMHTFIDPNNANPSSKSREMVKMFLGADNLEFKDIDTDGTSSKILTRTAMGC